MPSAGNDFDPANLPDITGMPPEIAKLHISNHQLQARIYVLETHLPARIKEAVEEAIEGRLPTEDERRWVQLAVKRQAQSVAFRQAVIEKTLPWLIIAAVGFVGHVIREYMINHGMWKP